ncbi:MAG: uracil-DNA glycosylase [Gemmatimonadota bacterium]|nr:MAG: uracil-DNA glycosylase [Gemmatimonadota bacterium]
MSSQNMWEVVSLVKTYVQQQTELGTDEWYIARRIMEKPGPTRTLSQLCREVKDCRNCHLWRTRTNFVFGTGPDNAGVAFIGEAPGKDEDLQGEPFVGRAGQLLTRILEAIQFRREDVFIGNILKCRPPENRDPAPEEIEQCLSLLEKQLQIIRPKIICALGRIAAQTLLRTSAPLSRLRGKVHDLYGMRLVVTYHPAALLRNPHLKRPTWEDMQLLRREYDRLK